MLEIIAMPTAPSLGSTSVTRWFDNHITYV